MSWGVTRSWAGLAKGEWGRSSSPTIRSSTTKSRLKIPRFTSTDDGQTIQRFYREARAAIKLRHSNLCPVYDVGEIGGQHYLVMAYIEGRPLSAFINPNRPLPERQIARLVCKVALALQEAHQNGVVHRDLKPSNIMFDEKRKEPIVMDFGLATQIGCSEARLTQAGTLIGSPTYMSPEQVRGSADEIGPPSDIYSLGVILYELLTGRVPFEGPTALVLGMIAIKDPAPPSSVRPGIDLQLEAICMKAMAKNIADRYVSMREFARALADYAGSHSTKSEGSNSPAADAAESFPTKPLSEDPLLAIAAIAESDGRESHASQARAAPRSRSVPLLTAAGIVAAASAWGCDRRLALLKPGPKRLRGKIPPTAPTGRGGCRDAGAARPRRLAGRAGPARSPRSARSAGGKV